jgi:hypothetical protein
MQGWVVLMETGGERCKQEMRETKALIRKETHTVPLNTAYKHRDQ